MARYAVQSRMKSEEVISRAKAHFGEDGLGLNATDRNPCCVYFEGGGGHVLVTATEGDTKTKVELETREWDYQVEQFMNQIA